MFDQDSVKADDPAWAWARYAADAQRPWNLKMAGHLYRRAAFGATWPQLQQALKDGPQRTIDQLLRGDDAEGFNDTMNRFEMESTASDSPSVEPIRHWWLRRMIQTPHPLLEKMCLFWHGFFGIDSERVQNGRLMRQYLDLLRSKSLGRFSAMLPAVMQEPAVMASADLGATPPSPLAENLARRLLEHYSVGPGNYSAGDVKETARAFSGWIVSRGQARYLDQRHDEGPKSIFGESGAWTGQDAVRIALGRPATALRVVRRLYRWLVSEAHEPSDELLTPLAQAFAKDWDVAQLVGMMLRSNRFFSAAAYRQRIKSPVEYAVGIVRPLEAVIPTAALDVSLIAMGQDLCRPPTIEGWQGGHAWINPHTLVTRSNLAAALLCGQDPFGDKLRPVEILQKHGRGKSESARDFFLDFFLQGDVDAVVRDALPPQKSEGTDAAQSESLRLLVHQIVILPEFHLA